MTTSVSAGLGAIRATRGRIPPSCAGACIGGPVVCERINSNVIITATGPMLRCATFFTLSCRVQPATLSGAVYQSLCRMRAIEQQVLASIAARPRAGDAMTFTPPYSPMCIHCEAPLSHPGLRLQVGPYSAGQRAPLSGVAVRPACGEEGLKAPPSQAQEPGWV
jgi:hypothetical protein